MTQEVESSLQEVEVSSQKVEGSLQEQQHLLKESVQRELELQQEVETLRKVRNCAVPCRAMPCRAMLCCDLAVPCAAAHSLPAV